jgi:hypothetical protein
MDSNNVPKLTRKFADMSILQKKRKRISKLSETKQEKGKLPKLERTGMLPKLERTDIPKFKEYKRKQERCQKEKEEIEYLKEQLRQCQEKQKKSTPKTPIMEKSRKYALKRVFSKDLQEKIQELKKISKPISKKSKLISERKLREQKEKLKKLDLQLSKERSIQRKERYLKEINIEKNNEKIQKIIDDIYKAIDEKDIENAFDFIVRLNNIKDLEKINNINNLKEAIEAIKRQNKKIKVKQYKKFLQDNQTELKKYPDNVKQLDDQILSDIEYQIKVVDLVLESFDELKNIIKKREELQKKIEREEKERKEREELIRNKEKKKEQELKERIKKRLEEKKKMEKQQTQKQQIGARFIFEETDGQPKFVLKQILEKYVYKGDKMKMEREIGTSTFKKNMRKLMAKYHPDKNQGQDTDFKRLNDLYKAFQ